MLQVPQYLEFNELVEDSIGFIGVTSKYSVAAEFIGVLFIIWPPKNKPNLRDTDNNIMK